MTGLMNLRFLISDFIPVGLIAEKKQVLFDTLVSLLTKEGVSKDPIVDQIFAFLASDSHLQTALGWLQQSKITINDQDVYDL